MTSRERVLAAFSHDEPDRVPTGYVAMEGVDSALKQHFGLTENDREGLLNALNVDIAYSIPWYKGPALFAPVEGRRITAWGVHLKWVETAKGDYWDYCDFPLRDAGPEELAAWPMPEPCGGVPQDPRGPVRAGAGARARRRGGCDRRRRPAVLRPAGDRPVQGGGRAADRLGPEPYVASPRVAGMTHWNPESPSPLHEIALRVDPARFFSQYFGVFKKS